MSHPPLSLPMLPVAAELAAHPLARDCLLGCAAVFVVAALLFAFGSFGGPVSSLQLQAVHVLHEMYWLDPARTSSCGQAICSAVAFGGGGGAATAFAFATAFATGAAAAAAAADFVGAAFKVAFGLAKGVAR